MLDSIDFQHLKRWLPVRLNGYAGTYAVLTAADGTYIAQGPPDRIQLLARLLNRQLEALAKPSPNPLP